MNCANHPETVASAFCRECGKPMCLACQRPALGSVYCQDHLPVLEQPPSPASPWGTHAPPHASPYEGVGPAAGIPDPGSHPTLALLLGFFPGVGAIYNGQYAKGLVHAVIFGLLITAITNAHSDGLQALLGIMIGTWVIYQAFEAFHTARQRRYGVRLEEFSSLFGNRQMHGRSFGGGIILIAIGFILLLVTTDIIRTERLERFWPALLIVIGGYMLYSRLNPAERNTHPADREARR